MHSKHNRKIGGAQDTLIFLIEVLHRDKNRGQMAFSSGAKGRAFESRRARHRFQGLAAMMLQVLFLMGDFQI